jgi:hypothetical protein
LSALTRLRSSARSSRPPGRSSSSSRLETPSIRSSASSSLSSRRETSSSMEETPTSPTRSGAPLSSRRRVSSSLDPESLAERKELVTAPVSVRPPVAAFPASRNRDPDLARLPQCPEEPLPPGPPSRRFSRRPPLRLTASLAATGLESRDPDTYVSWRFRPRKRSTDESRFNST